MSLKKYVDSAWSDVDSVKRHNGSEWKDCDSVKKYNTETQAWEDVWTGELMCYFYPRLSSENCTSTKVIVHERTTILNVSVVSGADESTFASFIVTGDFGKKLDVEFSLNLSGTGLLYIEAFHTDETISYFTELPLQPTITDETKQYSMEYSKDIKGFMFQMFTATAELLSTIISDLKINGKKVNFKEVKI